MNKAEQFRLVELAERYADGRLSEDEGRALDAQLLADAEARTVFAKALHQHAELRFDKGLTHDLLTPPVRTKSVLWRYVTTAAAAACIAMVAGWFMFRESKPSVLPSPRPTNASGPAAACRPWRALASHRGRWI